ncbi:ATP-binding protein [Bacillus sp. FJAT-52991]|uniref:ATP-binding protein n=1 Tax=Bacillus kandeliae TaxID=3129297 RepID=A0ABZ2N878_9BACI
MKRDVLVIPFDTIHDLVISSDNSGAIGNKQADVVQVPYETVSYYSFRVALMECLAAGGEPFAVVIHNFSGDEAWHGLLSGVKKTAKEADIPDLAITGSTETNFQMMQSATGIVVMGKKKKEAERPLPANLQYAVIGKPLVGPEVLAEASQVAPLALFRKVLQMDGVHAVLPVGSKGILHEIKNMTGREELMAENLACALDVEKTAGPSTCFVVGFEAEVERVLWEVCGGLVFVVNVIEV